MVLATVVSAKTKPGFDFFPLTVNYPGKRLRCRQDPRQLLQARRSSERKETLVRVIDRPIRPLFADGYKSDTQVVVTVQHDGRTIRISIVATSAALSCLSGVPFMGPIRRQRQLHQ